MDAHAHPAVPRREPGIAARGGRGWAAVEGMGA